MNRMTLTPCAPSKYASGKDAIQFFFMSWCNLDRYPLKFTFPVGVRICSPYPEEFGGVAGTLGVFWRAGSCARVIAVEELSEMMIVSVFSQSLVRPRRFINRNLSHILSVSSVRLPQRTSALPG